MKLYVIEKNGSPIMAGALKVRVFKSYKAVQAFISNLIRVSNSLTRGNFEIIDLSV